MADLYSLEERCLVGENGEAILNKKAVYEPSKGQRFRQIVCSKSVAISILIGMGVTMIGIALIAAFARPSGTKCSEHNGSGNSLSSSPNMDKGNSLIPSYIATNGQEFPWKRLRLPSDIRPIHYDIFLYPNIEKSYFKGNVKMTLKVLEKTNFIVFHTHQLNLSDVVVEYSRRDASASVNSFSCPGLGVDGGNSESAYPPGHRLKIGKVLEFTPHQQYYVQVLEYLQPGVEIDLTVNFRGSLADVTKMSGLYKSSYTVRGQKRYMVSTQFEASSARQAFPCMDEPALKATFSMKLVRDRSLVGLFNTKKESQEPYTDEEDKNNQNLVVDTFKPTVCMSTYLVAVVVTDFKSRTKFTRDNVMVRIWAPEDKIYMGEFALDAAVSIIDKYNIFFGIPYPLEKQDLIAIPNFSAGAMENWGLITYRDESVLFDKDKSPASIKRKVAMIVAHELAHQWFGNLVTMKWWNDLWLNEGFASYVETIGVDTVNPSFKYFETLIFEGRRTMGVDSLKSSHPIETKVMDPAQIESAFNSITYKKGACLIAMLRGAIGSNEFHQGLKYYLVKHSYQNAETKDLWEAFEKFSDLGTLKVSKIMDTWTKQMGYPVVTLTRDNDIIKVTQERFLMNNDSSSYLWYIPFKYKLSDNPENTRMVWMEKGDITIHLPSSSSTLWVKGNSDGEGFYRVNYDPAGWKAITQQLLKDHKVFSAMDRLTLVDDAFTMAQSGRIDYSVVLDLCKYLVKEEDSFVWKSAFEHFLFLSKRLYLHESYDDFKTYIIHLATPLLNSVGWNDTGSFQEKELRTKILSLGAVYDYEPVINEARKLFEKWLANEDVELNNYLRPIIYNIGIKYGTKSDWDKVYERFITSIVPADKQSLLLALSFSQDSRVLQILLERSLDPTQIKSQSTETVVANVASNTNGLLQAWRFLQEKWDLLFKRFSAGSFTMSELVSSVLDGFSKQIDLDNVKSFFKNRELGVVENAFHQSLDVIKFKIAWENHYLKPVSEWLEIFVKTSSAKDKN